MDENAVLDISEPLAQQFEGFSATPYQDAGGVWTIGYGSTWDYRNQPVTRVTKDTPEVSQEVAKLMLLEELKETLDAVIGIVHVPLTAEQWAALDDFAFNLGVGNLRASTLLRKLNQGDYLGAAEQFDLWDHCSGKVLAGLLRRRAQETSMFLGGA